MAGHCRNTSNISLANDSVAFAEEAEMPFLEIFKLTFEVLIALFGIIGNFLVVIVISRLGKKKQATVFYVQNLAIADLGTLTFTFSLGVIKDKAPFNWPFGEFACRYLYLIPEIFYGASVWYITVIAIDRYLKVVTVKNIRHKVNTSLQRARAVAAAVLLQFSVALKFTFSLGVIKDKAPFNWPFGEFACRYLYLIPEVFYSASVWYITVIAIDRYLKVMTVKNIRHKVNNSLQRARAVAVFVWAMSFLILCLPLYFVVEYKELSNRAKMCGPFWPQWAL